jgi:hypothetical protein
MSAKYMELLISPNIRTDTKSRVYITVTTTSSRLCTEKVAAAVRL